MKIQIQRDKDPIFSMHRASIIVDNKKVGSVGNGHTETFTCPNDSASLSVRSGPYISDTINLANLEQQDITLSIGPKNKFPDIVTLGIGAAAASVTLSRLFDIKGLLAILALVLLLDFTLFRVKWRVTIDNLDTPK